MAIIIRLAIIPIIEREISDLTVWKGRMETIESSPDLDRTPACDGDSVRWLMVAAFFIDLVVNKLHRLSEVYAISLPPA